MAASVETLIQLYFLSREEPEMLGRTILWLSALVFIAYGLVSLISPAVPAGFAGLVMSNGDAFAEVLRARKLVAHFRRSRGKDIDAACGQLAGEVQDRTRVQQRLALLPAVQPMLHLFFAAGDVGRLRGRPRDTRPRRAPRGPRRARARAERALCAGRGHRDDGLDQDLAGRRGALRRSSGRPSTQRVTHMVEPSGGLFSTAADMGRFYAMIAAGGELDGVRILSGKAVKAMTTPVVAGGKSLNYACGWQCNTETQRVCSAMPDDALGPDMFFRARDFGDAPMA